MHDRQNMWWEMTFRTHKGKYITGFVRREMGFMSNRDSTITTSLLSRFCAHDLTTLQLSLLLLHGHHTFNQKQNCFWQSRCFCLVRLLGALALLRDPKDLDSEGALFQVGLLLVWAELLELCAGLDAYKIFRNSQDHNSKKRWRIYKTW